MPYRKVFFEKNQPVHIVSRAVEGLKIYNTKTDCFRFIFQFYAANIGRRNSNINAKDAIKAGQALLRGEKVSSRFIIKEHPPLVDLLDFSLVINHYHLYLLPNVENIIPTLVKKLNQGFALSFNLIHNRKDAVFGSRYRGIVVKTDFQSAAVSRYVSVINPLDVFQPGWRENGLKNWKEAFEFLGNYLFSSFPDRIGKRKSTILASGEILERFPFGGDHRSKKEFRKFTEEFLKERSNLPHSYFLE